MSTRSKSNKKLTKAQKKEQDLNDRLDEILNSMSELKSQNSDLKEQFSEVQERLDSVENSSPKCDVLNGRDTSQQESGDDQNSLKNDDLRKSVSKRLKGLLTSDSSSESEDDVITFKSSEKSKKKNLKKSGKLKTSQHKILRYVDWPQFYVFRRDCGEEGVKCDTLSLAEFMHGYLQLMQHEESSRTRAYMYDHLTNLTADASEYPWPVVRNFHSIVLCMMEAKRLDWRQTAVLQDLRRQYVWSAPSSNKSNKPQADVSNVKACYEFQSGKCSKTGPSHNGYHHVCSYCLRTAKKSCQHPENECIRKTWRQNGDSAANDAGQASKNARGGVHP